MSERRRGARSESAAPLHHCAGAILETFVWTELLLSPPKRQTNLLIWRIQRERRRLFPQIKIIRGTGRVTFRADEWVGGGVHVCARSCICVRECVSV